MKLLNNILLASILAFAAAALPASSAHAIGRSPVLQAHLQGTEGRWNRGGATNPYGHNAPPPSVSASTVPELDASSASSALALLLAVAMLGAGYRRKDEDGLALPC